jgi:ribonuclease Z
LIEIEVFMLGTSAAAPTKERNLSGIAIRYNGKTFLLDCGEGTQRQMLKYGLNIYKIEAIFLTHIHGDHVIGIAGLTRTLSLYGRTGKLRIYIPKGYSKALSMLLHFDNPVLKYEIEIIEVGRGTIYSDEEVSVKAFALKHSVQTCGYSFEERWRYRFTEKAKRLGIKGREFSEIQKKGSIMLNGKNIKIRDVTELVEGRKVVYATDTRPVEATVRAGKGADLIIHDASYTEEDKRLARERMHSTAAEAAKIAKKAGAKRLILTHISTRYKDTKDNLKEAREIFRNCDVAEDGMKVSL